MLMLAGLLFTACNNDSADNNDDSARTTITVFNWGDFIHPDVVGMFEEETGIRVTYSMYESNESMYERLVRVGGFDVLFPSDYMIERLISEGLLHRLNWDNLPNASYIEPKFWEFSENFDPGNLYSMPYMWGTFGILYNSTMVDIPVESWQILWDEQFAGQIFMYDIARDTFGVAQKMLGFSLNSTNLEELHAARDALITQRPLVRAFQTDQIRDSMINREGALAVIYSGDAIVSMEENPELRFVVPMEGTQLFFDSMVIPASSQNIEAAEAFINFMTRPDIALMNTEFIGYSTTNTGAFEMLDEDMQNNSAYWPPDYVLYRSEVFKDLGEFRALMEEAWIEVMLSR